MIMRPPSLTVLLLTKLMLGSLAAGSVQTFAFNLPPANPYLADSNYTMAHADPAQQDALPQHGPIDVSRRLDPEEIQYTHTGPAFFGILTSGLYADGERVFWGNGLDRIVKLDYDTGGRCHLFFSG